MRAPPLQAQGGNPDIITVRIWERSGTAFTERLHSTNNEKFEEIPEQVRRALSAGQHPRAVGWTPIVGDRTDHTRYRVFATITEPGFGRGQVSGAVELVQQINTVPSIVRRYAQTAALLALAAVALTSFATYWLFRYLVYRPMRGLIYAMARAKAGSLGARVEVRARDEFGRLGLGFNRMIERIADLTREREAQQQTLRERVRDATEELQQRNQQLAEANQELWQASRRLSQMERLAVAGQTAAQFAHEVGTPLNILSIHLELLRDSLRADPAGAEQRTYIMGEQLERIERIVRTMLDRTRIEKPQLARLNLRELLERICDTTQPTLALRGVRLVKALDSDLPPIAGDADRLQQVFINLFNNAMDAMPGGGELRVTADFAGERVRVAVVDTGIGMNEETQAHIFDLLYTTKERGRGTGLGLVVVKQIVAEHNGSIAVESEPRHGARFQLSFPVFNEVMTAPATGAASPADLELAGGAR